MKKILVKIAGFLNLLTAMIHLLAGQVDLVTPLLNSDLTMQQKGELLSVWHMITILLFATSYFIIRAGFSQSTSASNKELRLLGILYILSGTPFIIISFWFWIFAPQWILLMPIGFLIIAGLNKENND